jgi:hypothetical protein
MGNFGTKYAVSINGRDYSGTGVGGLLSSVIEEDGVDYISTDSKFAAFERVTKMYKDDMTKRANEMMATWKNNRVPENQIAGKLVTFFQDLIKRMVANKMSFGTNGMVTFGNAATMRFGSSCDSTAAFGRRSRSKSKKSKKRKSSFGKGKKGEKGKKSRKARA